MNSLRTERDELPPSRLSQYEMKERLWKLECYTDWKAAGVDIPLTPCARQLDLLAEWQKHSDYGTGKDDSLHQGEAVKCRKKLLAHASYCPQCQVFPVGVPYLTDEGLKALHQ